MTITVAGVSITHPERVLFPAQGLTKGDLAAHFERVAPHMLPHVERRPLALVRCPRGADNACFFQKHPQGSEPEGVLGVEVPEGGGRATHFAVEGARGLVGMAQLGVLEVHVWGSRVDAVERPDRLVFDLDPDEALSFDAVKDAAKALRRRCEDDGLHAFVMTTGGKGLHVVAPLEPRASFDDARAYAREVAEALVADAPERFVATASKEARAGKIYIDTLRNGLGATAIAPYSTRARRGAPVATPLRWDELSRIAGGDAYDARTIARRLAALGSDPWEGYADARRRLP